MARDKDCGNKIVGVLFGLQILHTGFMLLILELTVPNGLVLQWERMLNEDSDE